LDVRSGAGEFACQDWEWHGGIMEVWGASG
jgi:hypothetical protein